MLGGPRVIILERYIGAKVIRMLVDINIFITVFMKNSKTRYL